MESNRMIAEFMGFKVEPFENKGGTGFDVTLNCPQPKSMSCARYGTLDFNKETVLSWKSRLIYNRSWKWLMPVVEKIEALPHVYNVDIDGTNCIISSGTPQGDGGNLFKVLFDIDGKTKLEATYNAVTEFITWYNKEKDGK